MGGGAGEEAMPRPQEVPPRIAQPGAVNPNVEGQDDDDEQGRWICPLDERRSVCPISGETLTKTWSHTLNDWAYVDVVAAEPGLVKPIRFPPGGAMGPHGLSETAVLFKRSCFFNTAPSRRLRALEECRAPAASAAELQTSLTTQPGIAAAKGLSTLSASEPHGAA